jgi:lipoic acid synthetase
MRGASTGGDGRRRLPAHLRRRFQAGGRAREVEDLLEKLDLHTVCHSAHCPNRSECFGSGTATFLILGDACTRQCRFCAIPAATAPSSVDWQEPERIAAAVRALGLRYAVITSVTRDDLPLGGADLFAACIRRLREENPAPHVEVLTPDFGGNRQALEMVLNACPDVFSHNVETAPDLYPDVRPEANYARSLGVLRWAAGHSPPPLTKSGLMVGLGETETQVLGVMDDLRNAGCEVLTIGQYLAPSPAHHPVVEYIGPERFDWYRREALRRGFRHVASGPFVRSSYRAHAALSATGSTQDAQQP